MRNRTRLRIAVIALGACAVGGIAGAAIPAYAWVGGDVIRHDSIQNLVIAKDIQFTNGSSRAYASMKWTPSNSWATICSASSRESYSMSFCTSQLLSQ